jgi:hypothetical protein
MSRIQGVVNTEIVADKTVREIERMDAAIQAEIVRRGGTRSIKAGFAESMGIPQQEAIAAMIVWGQIRHFRYTDEGVKLTIRELKDIAESVRMRFIRQHAINYAAYYVIESFYDWLNDKKLIARYSKTEGYWRKLNREFGKYKQYAVGQNERVSKMLFMDYVNQAFGNIESKIEPMEVAIRDYLIQHRSDMVASGQKDDIQTIQKVAVCLYFLSFMQHHFYDFFLGFIKEYGVDLSVEFQYADLRKMTLNFIFMCEAQGIKFRTVCGNEKNLVGVDVENSVRVNAAWNAIVDTINDDELSDETARKAIEMNPDAEEEYNDLFAEIETERDEKKRKEMEEGFKMLEEKYKVTKQK